MIWRYNHKENLYRKSENKTKLLTLNLNRQITRSNNINFRTQRHVIQIDYHKIALYITKRQDNTELDKPKANF